MKDRLNTILKETDRKVLLRELETLRLAPTFPQYANIWAPVVYKIDPEFFKPFIKYNINQDQLPNKTFIKELMDIALANNDVDFYKWLYPIIKTDKDWNKDLLELCNIKDDKLFANNLAALNIAIAWRVWNLNEDTAIALYKRAQVASKELILNYTGSSIFSLSVTNLSMSVSKPFHNLLTIVKNNKDDDFYWELFRKIAKIDDWKLAINDLIANKPRNNIVQELEKRSIQKYNLRSEDVASILISIYQNWGSDSLPYIRKHLHYFVHAKTETRESFLNSIKKRESEETYFEIFINSTNEKFWQDTIKNYLKDKSLSKEKKRKKLIYLSQPINGATPFRLSDDLAIEVYNFSPDLLYKHFSEHINYYCPELFDLAEKKDDLELYKIIMHKNFLISWFYTQFYTNNQKKSEIILDKLILKLENILSVSVDQYVQVLYFLFSGINAYELWNTSYLFKNNPFAKYVFKSSNDVWLNYPDLVRGLLESPSIFVQIKAIEILCIKNPAAIPIIKNNLDILLAIILKRYHKGTLKMTYKALENGAINDAEIAGIILPRLLEASVIKSKKYPRDNLIALLGKIKYYQPKVGWILSTA